MTIKYNRGMKYRIFTAVALVLLIAGCGYSQPNNAGTSAGSPGSIVISGSTALLPLVKEAAVEYQSAHPNVKISVAGGGSRVGITQVAQRAVDIGDSDIPAPNEPSLVDHAVAVVTFGIIVNPQTGVKNLSTAQIRGIFSGKIANWSQAGGRSGPITVINRPRSSGTRAVLVQNILGGHEPSEGGLTQDSSGTVAAMVAQTPGAISYAGMAYVKPGSQVAVTIDGVSPSVANVESDKYKYWSQEHMFTNGQPSAQVAGFINYVKDDRALLCRLKFIPENFMILAALKGSRLNC
jgi:phosphate transport system substrate-binding protein